MAKKVIRYYLTSDGSIPAEVGDGGYFPNKNSNSPPQDWDLIGVTEDGSTFTGEQEFTTKSALSTYMTSIGAPFNLDGNEMTAAEAATIIWDKKAA